MPSSSALYSCIGAFIATAFAAALLWLSPPNAVAPEMAWSISVSSILLYGGLGVLVVCLGTCREIVADEAGLRWRLFPGIGLWRKVRWNEITDFFLQDHQTRCVIQTELGTLAFEKRNRKHIEALCDFIAARSQRAPCREWEERGFRSGERWPVIFEYGSEIAHVMLGGSIVVGLTVLAFAGFRAPSAVRSVWEHGYIGGLVNLIVDTGIFLLFEAAIVLAALWASRSIGRIDRIAVDEHGISWIRNESVVEADWTQVKSYYYRGMNCVVETSSALIEFTGLINDARLLGRLIRFFAPDAEARGRREHPGISPLIGPPEIRHGEQVFVYRTKLNFVGSCIPTFFASMFLLGACQESLRSWWPDWDKRFARSTPAELAMMGVLGAAIALLSLWLWQRLFTGKIVLNTDAITQHGPFGVRSIKWTDVQAVTTSKRVPPFFFYIIHGTSHCLCIWTGISSVLELETEINRHIPEKLPKVRLLPAACYDDTR